MRNARPPFEFTCGLWNNPYPAFRPILPSGPLTESRREVTPTELLQLIEAILSVAVALIGFLHRASNLGLLTEQKDVVGILNGLTDLLNQTEPPA